MLKRCFYLVVCVALFAGCHKDDDDDKLVIGEDYVEKGVSGFSFDMVYVAGGTFRMGATEEQGEDAWGDEKPVHSVTLSDYYIGKFEVTQGLWKAVMGTGVEEQMEKAGGSDLYGVGDDYPMYYVSWDEAQEFVSKLSELTGKKYVLPTEAQWEYAARGGVKSRGYKYSGSNTIDDVAWYWENSEEKYSTSSVGTKLPNELGIYDMSGNVWEWCSDWYGDYSDVSQTDPTGPSSGSSRVCRGGSWLHDARDCRVSSRNRDHPDHRNDFLGFRVALVF
ncbi:formylglycine-generating enzyme family protein [Odoribacter sp. Z80]|uniref:formylglycine-generating enzyme family protein n=1 Tax=Odoribacter sp. Z80 TaxID=2304575 RepID=UPI00137B0906|nr:formylglycine-generating enzyme family protein [Odoribacter sp. Z80]NCE72432.1 formylglycine-generating enzyme family protein [Odoribacter sp. Z80]